MAINKSMFSSARDDWETPQALFEELNNDFAFNLDVCASLTNAKCKEFFDKETDGLAQSWAGHRCYMNPPYGRQIKKWVKKASEETQQGRQCLVVALLPARTDTAWFHDLVLPFASVRFVRGRILFEIDGKPALDDDGRPQSAPFPSMIAVFGGPRYHCGIQPQGKPHGRHSE